MRSIGHFIGGKEVKGNSGRTADVFEPMASMVKYVFVWIVGAPPGAAEYWNCGMKVPAALMRTTPSMVKTITSVVDVDAALICVAVATALSTMLSAARPAASPVFTLAV